MSAQAQAEFTHLSSFYKYSAKIDSGESVNLIDFEGGNVQLYNVMFFLEHIRHMSLMTFLSFNSTKIENIIPDFKGFGDNPQSSRRQNHGRVRCSHGARITQQCCDFCCKG